MMNLINSCEGRSFGSLLQVVSADWTGQFVHAPAHYAVLVEQVHAGSLSDEVVVLDSKQTD